MGRYPPPTPPLPCSGLPASTGTLRALRALPLLPVPHPTPSYPPCCVAGVCVCVCVCVCVFAYACVCDMNSTADKIPLAACTHTRTRACARSTHVHTRERTPVYTPPVCVCRGVMCACVHAFAHFIPIATLPPRPERGREGRGWPRKRGVACL